MYENRNFASTAVKPVFTFLGITPYVQREALRLGVGPMHEGRVYGLFHVKQIQDGLGQLPCMPEAARPEMLKHIMATRDGLALALAGCDAAIADVTEAIAPGPSPADIKPIRQRKA